MKIKSILAALLMGGVMFTTAACGAQNGCYDDGERVSCNSDNDEDDDEGDEGDED